jgi:hypothetical protein
MPEDAFTPVNAVVTPWFLLGRRKARGGTNEYHAPNRMTWWQAIKLLVVHRQET